MTAARTSEAPAAVPPRAGASVGAARAAGRTRVWRPGRPLDVAATLGPLRRGPRDPAYWRETAGALWLAGRTPVGPGTLRVAAAPSRGEVHAEAWGAGAEWLLDGLPELLGDRDDPTGFVPVHPVVRDSARRHPGWRVTRTRRVLDALVPAILEQKVTTVEAQRSWRELLLRFGAPAPGPSAAALRVPPTAREWALIPSWEWHRAGVDEKRSRAIVTASRVAQRMEETIHLDPAEARRRMTTLPGVGPWTAAEVMQRAHGDADAISIGDLHVPRIVGYALVGEPTDDAGMLELLTPYVGHRYRAFGYIALSGIGLPPRRAPRATLRDFRRF